MIDSLVRKYILPAVLGFSLSVPAYARDEVPELGLERITCHDAKTCYKSGLEEFKLGQYERAEALFKQATSLAPSETSKAKMLSNLGTTCLLGGKLDLANNYFRTYLEQNIENIQREEVKAGVALESRVPTRQEINSLLVGIELYRQGEKSFLQSNFEESIIMYTQAQRYFEQNPGLKLSALIAIAIHLPLGRAYDNAGKFAPAHREYQLYVDTAATSAETPKVQERIQELEQLLAPKKEEKVVPLVPSVVAPPPRVVSSPPESFFQQHQWSLLTASGAAALGVGALVNHRGANANYQDLRDRCKGNDTCSPADAEGIRTRDTITAILGISSALALGTAGVLFYLEMPKYVPTPTAEGLEWRVRF